MKSYIVFTTATGEIVRTGICPDNMIEIQAQQGESVLEGVANDIEYKIIKNTIIRRDQKEIDMTREKMKPDPKEVMINEKMNELLRNWAIDELKKEGKL